MSRLRNEVVCGLILLVFAISMYLFIIPAQVKTVKGVPLALSPSLFCHMITFLLLLLSLSLVIAGLKDKNTKELPDIKKMLGTASRGSVAVILSVLYIIAMEYIGYFTSTVIFMVLFLWFSGVRSWKGSVLFLVVILPFIYLLFVKALKVMLPSGLLI